MAAIGRPQFNGPTTPGWVVLAAFVILAAVAVAINQATYGDWRCLFAECRIEAGK